MIHVSDAFKEAWLNGNQKEILLNFSDGSTLTNDDVVSESFSLVQSVCEEEQITFGLTSSAQVSVQIYNSGKQYKGLTMSVTLIAGEYPMQIGVFKIDDDVRSDDRIYRTLTGYDALKDVLNNDYSAWHNALSSMTLKQYRDAFFSHIGISQVSTNLLNDGLTINIKTVQSLSGAEIIRYICEPNACFGFVNNVGMFQYTEPIGLGKHYPADDLYPANDLYPGDGIDVVMTAQDDELAPIMGGVVCSDYNTHRITQVRFNYSENTPEVTYGVPGNRYELTSNVLMYGQSENVLLGVLQNFMSNVEGFFYTPGRLSGRARVWAQLGDIVGAAVKDMSVAFPILRRSMKGITALYDEYEARGKEYYTYSANTYERRITDAETASYEQAGQIDDINNDIEEIHENIGDLEITFEKTIDGLEARVAGSQKEWDTTGYNVTEFGYDSPTAEGYEPSEYTGEYYLNQTNGYLYYSNGSAWNLIKYCSTIQVALQSQINQTPHTISMSVSGTAGSTSAAGITITLKDANGNIVDSADGNVYIDGNVVFRSNLTDGTTQISGSNITTGSISANRISGGTLQGVTIIANDDFQIAGSPNCHLSTSGYGSLRVGSYTGGTNGWIVCSDIYSNGSKVVTFNDLPSSDGVQSVSKGSPTQISSSTHRMTSLDVSGSKNVSITYNYLVESSDNRLKTNVCELRDMTKAYMELKPVSFEFKHDLKHTEQGLHYGLIAQDTEKALRDNLVYDYNNNLVKEVPVEEDDTDIKMYVGDKYYMINYEELHALHIQMIQKQQKKIEELENRIKILEEER